MSVTVELSPTLKHEKSPPERALSVTGNLLPRNAGLAGLSRRHERVCHRPVGTQEASLASSTPQDQKHTGSRDVSVMCAHGRQTQTNTQTDATYNITFLAEVKNGNATAKTPAVVGPDSEANHESRVDSAANQVTRWRPSGRWVFSYGKRPQGRVYATGWRRALVVPPRPPYGVKQSAGGNVLSYRLMRVKDFGIPEISVEVCCWAVVWRSVGFAHIHTASQARANNGAFQTLSRHMLLPALPQNLTSQSGLAPTHERGTDRLTTGGVTAEFGGPRRARFGRMQRIKPLEPQVGFEKPVSEGKTFATLTHIRGLEEPNAVTPERMVFFDVLSVAKELSTKHRLKMTSPFIKPNPKILKKRDSWTQGGNRPIKIVVLGQAAVGKTEADPYRACVVLTQRPTQANVPHD
ncbi:hypothetical protein Bbelb_152470 [Branchiostoma belcheri]|nr:hypothetical protein Bbelb_152470 [Branchiostoma belcheri]